MYPQWLAPKFPRTPSREFFEAQPGNFKRGAGTSNYSCGKLSEAATTSPSLARMPRPTASVTAGRAGRPVGSLTKVSALPGRSRNWQTSSAHEKGDHLGSPLQPAGGFGRCGYLLGLKPANCRSRRRWSRSKSEPHLRLGAYDAGKLGEFCFRFRCLDTRNWQLRTLVLSLTFHEAPPNGNACSVSLFPDNTLEGPETPTRDTQSLRPILSLRAMADAPMPCLASARLGSRNEGLSITPHSGHQRNMLVPLAS